MTKLVNSTLLITLDDSATKYGNAEYDSPRKTERCEDDQVLIMKKENFLKFDDTRAVTVLEECKEGIYNETIEVGNVNAPVSKLYRYFDNV